MLPVVLGEFEMVYIFLLLFSFQKVNFIKNLGGGYSPPLTPSARPGFYGPELRLDGIEKKRKTSLNDYEMIKIYE